MIQTFISAFLKLGSFSCFIFYLLRVGRCEFFFCCCCSASWLSDKKIQKRLVDLKFLCLVGLVKIAVFVEDGVVELSVQSNRL